MRFLLLQAVPLSQANLAALTAGCSFLRTDQDLNPIGRAAYLPCALSYHSLPSPSFLFRQKIDPRTLREGLKERAFLEEIAKLIDDDAVIITYGAGYLQILEAMGLRNFTDPDLLSKASCVLDLKEALKVHTLLNGPSVKLGQSLLENARALGLPVDQSLEPWQQKLQALRELYLYLKSRDGPMLSFLQRPLSSKLKLVREVLASGGPLTLIENGQVCLFKAVSLNGTTVKGFGIDADLKLTERLVPLTRGLCLAPLGILNEQRQRALGLDVPSMKDKLLKFAAEHPGYVFKKQTLTEQFFSQLDERSRAFYQECKETDPRALSYAPLSVQKKLAHTLLLFRAANHFGTLIDEEQQYYYKMCSQILRKKAEVYVKELDYLAQNLDEKDKEGPALLNKIAAFIENL